MDLLLSMSLVGSLFFLIYLLIRPVIVLRFSSLWRYRILKITLLFFLLPYQHLKVKFSGLFKLLFSWLQRRLRERKSIFKQDHFYFSGRKHLCKERGIITGPVHNMGGCGFRCRILSSD